MMGITHVGEMIGNQIRASVVSSFQVIPIFVEAQVISFISPGFSANQLSETKSLSW